MEPEKLQKKQLRYKSLTGSKRALRYIIVLCAIVLVVLPFWNSFQDVLTRRVMSVGWYKAIQDVIVPYEIRIVSSLLTLMGFSIRVSEAYIQWVRPSGGMETIYLIWNCVGWQTLVLFIVTLITGLSGRHTRSSKLQALLIGIIGTYLINVIRLVGVVAIYILVGRPFGVVFHDYFSNIFSLSWLFFFWWFSFKYVLIERRMDVPSTNIINSS